MPARIRKGDPPGRPYNASVILICKNPCESVVNSLLFSCFFDFDCYGAVDGLGAPVPSVIVQVAIAGGKVEPLDHAGYGRVVALPIVELIWLPRMINDDLSGSRPILRTGG